MIKNIIIPIDFSEQTFKTIQKAKNLLLDNGGTIHLVHALQTQLFYSDMFYDGEIVQINSQELRKTVESKIQDIVDTYKSESVNFKLHIEIGTIIENIQEYIDENEYIDLVLLGTEGKNGIEELLLGSNTQRIVRFIERSPVLVIKNNDEEIQLNKVLIVSSFNEEDHFDMNKYVNLFDIHTCFDLLKVITPQHFETTHETNEKLDAFEDSFNGNIRHKEIYNYTNIEDGIKSYLNHHPEVNMVILPTHGRKGLSRFYYGSLTELVVNHLPIPVFTFKL